jgi:hypothetical protein
MLLKLADITIIPATPGDPGQPHTHECTTVSPGGGGPPDAGGDQGDNPFIYCRDCGSGLNRFTLCLPYPFSSCP